MTDGVGRASLAERVRGLARRRPTWFLLGAFGAAKAASLVLAYVLLGEPASYLHDLSLRWDGADYLAIARRGYGRDVLPGFNPIAFAPAWPALIKLAGATDLAPLLLANVLGFAAVAALRRLVGLRAALFFALFPTWLAFSSYGYSESLFVLLASLALLSFRHGHYQSAGTASGLAVAARYSSVAGFAALAIPMLRLPRRVWHQYLLPAVASGLVLLVFFQLKGGSLDAYLEAERSWGAQFAFPWSQDAWLLHSWFTNVSDIVRTHSSMWILRNYVFATVSVLGVWELLARDRDAALGGFSLVLLILALCTVGVPAASVPRLLLSGFPAVAVVGRRIVDPAAWILYGVLAVLATAWITVTHLTSFFA